MSSAGTRLTAATPIPALEPLRSINAALLELLDGLSPDDWTRPTVHADRNVKDLTAHLLHGSLRRVTALRDHYHPPARDIADIDDLIAFIQEDNRDFMNGMKRISPGILIELIREYDAQLVTLFEGLDPDAPGLGVAWAGEEQSASWFDIARECTEKWHHQQQLRDATGRPPLYDPGLLSPVLETFARGLPHAYRRFQADDGAALVVATRGPVALAWTLRRSEGMWTLWSGAAADVTASISLPCDVAWRLWTRSMDREDARARLELTGDPRAAEPVLDFVAIMA